MEVAQGVICRKIREPLFRLLASCQQARAPVPAAFAFGN
jgi:hypothetical protein